MLLRLLARLQYLLPRHASTALAWRIARIRAPWFKNGLIRLFVRAFDVDVDELARRAPEEFEHFNDFFTRELEPGSRPLEGGDDTVISPVDGRLSRFGTLDADRLLQAKGRDYALAELLPIDVDDNCAYVDGRFATIYLAPGDYHRVHAPRDGRLVAAHYVPGELFSVNETTAGIVPRLFCRNERINLHFETADGPMALVLVGAVNVGSMSTPWTGVVRARKRGVAEALDVRGAPAELARGDLVGCFNFGSTVIVLFPRGGCEWDDGLEQGDKLRMGQAIGRAAAAS